MTDKTGKEVCRVCTPNLEGELAKGGSREIAKDLDGSRSYHLIIVGGRGYALLISSWFGIMHCSLILLLNPRSSFCFGD